MMRSVRFVLALLVIACTPAAAARDMLATELIGSPVVDAHGEALGHIEDLIFGRDGDEGNYAVLSLDPRLGFEPKLYTYPLRGLHPGHDRLTLEDGRRELLPLALRQYDANAFIAEQKFVHASRMIGEPLERRAGKVEDLVVDLASGQLRHVVAQIDGKRITLPADYRPAAARSSREAR